MNRLNMFPLLARMLFLLGSILPYISFATEYAPGFSWHRNYDWIPGSVPGSSIGNPSSDKNGNPSWFYAYTIGDDINSANAWYRQELSPMVWDDVWFGGSGAAVWARGYNKPEGDNVDTNPPISKWTMIHDVSERTKSAKYMPVVEWRNPVGDGAIINVGGFFKLSWKGYYTDNSPDGLVDVAVALKNASTGSIDLLYSATLANPSEGGALSSFSAITTEPWKISNLHLDKDDALRFTVRLRSDEDTTPFWIMLDDQSTSIELVGIGTGVFSDGVLSFAVDIGTGEALNVKLRLIEDNPTYLFELDPSSIEVMPKTPTNIATFSSGTGQLYIPSVMIDALTVVNNVQMQLTNKETFQFTLLSYE